MSLCKKVRIIGREIECIDGKCIHRTMNGKCWTNYEEIEVYTGSISLESPLGDGLIAYNGKD